MMFISKTTDQYTPTLRWVACLSNDETVFHDTRPEELPAWYRLRHYIYENKVDIWRVMLEFMAPGHVEMLPDNKDGYYFSLGAGADWGSSRTEEFFVAGHLEEDGNIHLKWWLVPELIIRKTEQRHLSSLSVDEIERFLIVNPSKLDKYQKSIGTNKR